MAMIFLIVLVLLLAMGYLQIPALAIVDIPLITLFGYPISLMTIVVGLIIIFLIGLLPRAFRTVAVILLIVWLLSILGIVQMAGVSFSQIIVIALIALLVAYLLGGRR